MPTLPTIDVTAAQSTRLLSVFPGATQAEKVAAYKEWLKEQLRAHVLTVEMTAFDDEHRTARATRWAEVDAALPAPTPPPEPEPPTP